MVRKISQNYLEDSLINEFLLSKAVTREDCIQFFMNNIKDINRVLSDTEEPYFKYIYDTDNNLSNTNLYMSDIKIPDSIVVVV